MRKRIILNCIIIVILTFVFIFHSVNAKTINKLSFIGNDVKIKTKETNFKSNNSELNAIVPNIEYKSEIDDILNYEINNFTNKIIATFFKEYNKDNHHYLKIDYEVITDDTLWFTLKISVLESMASSDEYFKIYHIDKKNNKIINLNDLFKSNEYKSIFTKEIIKQMKERMKKDETLTYWIDDNMNDDFNLIDNEQNFYFNKSGEIVIVFDKYEVGPGSIGVQEFTINSKLYKDYLK